MAVRFISGKPGGGKSLYAVTILLGELEKGNRKVVTNLPLKLDNIQEYLHSRGVNKFVDDWIRILNEDETKQFYRYRHGLKIEDDRPFDKKGKREGELDYSPLFALEGYTGTLYFLDELHIHFNSRQWMHTGTDALFYLSQHRKLGDDVYCITQSINFVDKQFRDVTQDYTYLRNRAVEKFGIFKGRQCFERRVYLSPESNNVRPCETDTFTLDIKGVASCYDTAAGVGIVGTSADIGRKPKGLPWWTIWAGGTVVFSLLIAGVFMLPKIASAGIAGFVAPDIKNQSAQKSSLDPDEKITSQPVARPSGQSDFVEQDIYVTAYFEINGISTIYFSNGRRIKVSGVKIDGNHLVMGDYRFSFSP